MYAARVKPSSLFPAFIGSLLFHALCLLVLMQWPFGESLRLLLPVPTNGTHEKTLNVWLKAAKPDVAESVLRDTSIPVSANDSAVQVDDPNSGPQQTDVNFAPQLLTDVGSEIYGVVRSGSVIVRIDVDEQGQPSNLRRLYSDVPPEVVRQIERRVLAAKYQPARRDGVTVSDSLNIMVTLEPSPMLRQLGG